MLCDVCPHPRAIIGWGSDLLTTQSLRVWLIIALGRSIYRGIQGLWGIPLEVFKMAKVTRKAQTPLTSTTVTQKPTSSTKGRKHAKTSCQPMSRDSGKVRWSHSSSSCCHHPHETPPLSFPVIHPLFIVYLFPTECPCFHPPPHSVPPNQSPSVITLLSFQVTKTTTRVKSHSQRTLAKEASSKPSNPSRKVKKSRGSKLFGHYRRLNEVLTCQEPGWDQERVEKPTTSHAYLGSQ